MMCYGNQTAGTEVQRRKQWMFGESFIEALAYSKENPIDVFLFGYVFFESGLRPTPIHTYKPGMFPIPKLAQKS